MRFRDRYKRFSPKRWSHPRGNSYIEEAITKGVSARSNTHNRGFGLDTVVSVLQVTGGELKILSGNELFISIAGQQRTLRMDMDFSGTLIYFVMAIDSFEDSDYVDDFELF